MKKILTILLAMLMILMGTVAVAGCNEPDEKTLYVYTNAGFPPYEYMNAEGKVVGVDIDIMNKIGEELGYKVIINDIEFEQILNEVAGNKNAIGAAGMTKRPDRDEVAISSITYSTSVQYVIVEAGTFDESDLVDGKLPIAKLAEISNTGIGVQSDTPFWSSCSIGVYLCYFSHAVVALYGVVAYRFVSSGLGYRYF